MYVAHRSKKTLTTDTIPQNNPRLPQFHAIINKKQVAAEIFDERYAAMLFTKAAQAQRRTG